MRAEGQMVEAVLLHRPQVRVHVWAPAHLALLHATLDLLSLLNNLRHFDLGKKSSEFFFLAKNEMLLRRAPETERSSFSAKPNI